jgi:hypothetical protein
VEKAGESFLSQAGKETKTKVVEQTFSCQRFFS